MDMTRMKDIRTQLQQFTLGCRIDMHEPDEQDLSLVAVVGTKLDNATGSWIDQDAIRQDYQEAVVCLRREVDRAPGGTTISEFLQINLADLIALARLATIPGVE